MTNDTQVKAGQTFRRIHPHLARHRHQRHQLRDTTHHWMYTVKNVKDDAVYFVDDVGDDVCIAIDTFLNSFEPVSVYGEEIVPVPKAEYMKYQTLDRRVAELEKLVKTLQEKK